MGDVTPGGERPSQDEIEEALSMIACPYYDHEGVCESGCYQEPRCITDQPIDGWESVIEPKPPKSELAKAVDKARRINPVAFIETYNRGRRNAR